MASEIRNASINHALAVTIPETLSRSAANAFRFPANRTDGTHTPGIPMGAHIQLKPSYDISSLTPSWVQAVARALQLYGAYLIDTGGSLAFYAESVNTGTYPTGFNHNAIRAIDWSQLQVVTT